MTFPLRGHKGQQTHTIGGIRCRSGMPITVTSPQALPSFPERTPTTLGLRVMTLTTRRRSMTATSAINRRPNSWQSMTTALPPGQSSFLRKPTLQGSPSLSVSIPLLALRRFEVRTPGQYHNEQLKDCNFWWAGCREIGAKDNSEGQARSFRACIAGVGFRRPHLGWRAPRRFYHLYNSSTLDLAKVQTIGEDVPVLAYEMNSLNNLYRKGNETTTHQESPHGPPLPVELQQAFRHGYCELMYLPFPPEIVSLFHFQATMSSIANLRFPIVQFRVSYVG